MEVTTARQAMPGSAALLTFINAALFALGALLHIGVAVGPLQEPVAVPAMMLEALTTIALAVATMGAFTRAMWAHRLALFSNAFALLAVVLVTVFLAFDSFASPTGNTVLQIFRAVFALVSLALLSRVRARADS